MDREVWKSFQELKLGSEKELIKLPPILQHQAATNRDRSLIVKPLNPNRQSLKWMKMTLPKAWRLEGKVHGHVHDDGTILFNFDSEHNLLSVLEEGPWTFKDWLVVIDRWTNRNSSRSSCVLHNLKEKNSSGAREPCGSLLLKDSAGESILAVVGTERSVRHMFYVVSDEFVRVHGSENSIHTGFKWRSRREVVDWLTSMLSKQNLQGSCSSKHFSISCTICDDLYVG